MTLSPYYRRGGLTLYHGDNLAVLPLMGDASFAAVATDPPYGQSNEGYDRGVNPAVWAECLRLCRDGGALVSLAGSPTYHRIAGGIEAAGWHVRQMWAWVYKDGLITSAYPREGFDRLAPAMDPICFATKGKALLALKREGPAWECWAGRTGKEYSGRSNAIGPAPVKGPGHWPRSVVCTDGVEGFQYFMLSHCADRRDRTGHPNQKPQCLMEWAVAKLPAGPVLDPFAGSCTTLMAAAVLGREAVGVEISEPFCEMAARRLDGIFIGGLPEQPGAAPVS